MHIIGPFIMFLIAMTLAECVEHGSTHKDQTQARLVAWAFLLIGWIWAANG